MASLAAAYELGQHINRLHFFAVQAWIFDRLPILSDRPEIHSVPLVVQRCVDGVRCQEDFSNAVRQRIDDLVSTFSHDGHWDEACAAIGRFSRHLDGSPILNDHMVLGEVDHEITRTPAGLVSDVRNRIDAGLDEQQRRIIRLAETVDQAAYPRTICREILEDAIESQISTEGDAVLSWEEIRNSRPVPNLLNWPALPYEASRRPPPARWYRDLHHLCETAGIPNEAIASRLDQIRISEVGRLVQSAELLHADVQRTFTPNIAPYLGLQFEDGTLRLTREGLEGSVEFGRQRVPYGLVKFLSQRRDQWTDRRLLRQAWSSFSGTTEPENSTIDNAVDRLRQRLQALRVRIVAQPPMGFRLLDEQ